ncbi:RNA ligase RtcB family protein [Deltaproteobacteria bacterium Smac51]|nr:RNA ligase RtcB family protein [Deltaproteobacteria bacterium Smac51]
MTIRIFTNESNWMESAALKQLQSIAGYPAMVQVAGLPDLHAGRSPVGLAAAAENHIYPYLIGGDIGCGMGLFNTGLLLRKLKLDKWETRLANIREMDDLPFDNPFVEQSPIYNLGTIGGGNHFVEFQKLEEVMDHNALAELDFEPDQVLALVHTGSRGFGQKIMSAFDCETGYAADTPQAAEYLALHEQALMWAARNRALALARLLDWLGVNNEPQSLIDCPHNFVEKRSELYIHRKGALSSDHPLAVIPGSRGTLSFLVKPGPRVEESVWSLSHGAGRKWARSLCKSRLKNKYDRQSLRRTALKSRVVCRDADLSLQEAPEAYKNIVAVIAALVDNGLAEVVATLRPLLTYKG